MDVYKEMYLRLFNEMTDIKDLASGMATQASEIGYRVKAAQAAVEEMFWRPRKKRKRHGLVPASFFPSQLLSFRG